MGTHRIPALPYLKLAKSKKWTQAKCRKVIGEQLRYIELASGPPLGRRKASETGIKIKRQMYKDSCERNAIERRNGNAKRRVGLNRFF